VICKSKKTDLNFVSQKNSMQEKRLLKVTPHIPVADVEKTVEWYKQHLDFSEEWYWGNPVMDGGCRRDDLRLLFGKSPQPLQTPQEMSLIFFVSNVESVYEEMQQKNLKIVSPLKEYDYGIKEFTIEDLNGYRIRFAENV
jgi:uncharacterized glyoxalase superfamily protein PhnB